MPLFATKLKGPGTLNRDIEVNEIREIQAPLACKTVPGVLQVVPVIGPKLILTDRLHSQVPRYRARRPRSLVNTLNVVPRRVVQVLENKATLLIYLTTSSRLHLDIMQPTVPALIGWTWHFRTPAGRLSTSAPMLLDSPGQSSQNCRPATALIGSKDRDLQGQCQRTLDEFLARPKGNLVEEKLDLGRHWKH